MLLMELGQDISTSATLIYHQVVNYHFLNLSLCPSFMEVQYSLEYPLNINVLSDPHDLTINHILPVFLSGLVQKVAVLINATLTT